MTTTSPNGLQSRDSGVALVELRNDHVSVVVAPDLGAKVVSLKNLTTGRDWLSNETPRPLFRNEPGDAFASSTLCGWDECLPTVAPCSWAGHELPDHGEAWCRTWHVETIGPGEIHAAVELPLSRLRFTRELALRGNELIARYTLKSLNTVPQHFLWAMHPLIVPRQGDRVVLPNEALSQLSDASWLNTLDFGGRPPGYAKVFISKLTEGIASVVNDVTEDRLTLQWDVAENDTLGIWLTRGGWNGCHHLALEPTNAAADSLSDAIAQNHCGVITPGDTTTWAVRLLLEP